MPHGEKGVFTSYFTHEKATKLKKWVENVKLSYDVDTQTRALSGDDKPENVLHGLATLHEKITPRTATSS